MALDSRARGRRTASRLRHESAARVDTRRARRAGLQSSVHPENVLRVAIMWRGTHRDWLLNRLIKAGVSLRDRFVRNPSFLSRCL
ncbi:hypothetical protein [Paraburkholderia bannensis]|uniref:hypothetical protein n=1 Tax=Paraburkholderia bannensis TaxID=765414 RepID=UPI002AB5FB8C|nr:hypothetical protein [Paraburkholderia bannensis]